MNRIEARVLLYAAALAAGEGCAVLLGRGAEAWPLAAMLAAFVALFGYGRRLRGWTFAFTVCAGMALFLHAGVARERTLRASPWLRDRPVAAASAPAGFADFGRALRTDFSARVGLGLDGDRETVLLNRAILLGERSNLPKATKETFIASGTIHVFAISGLHVMLVARLLVFLAALFFVPYRWQGVIALPFVWGYVLLIGAPPSAVRAAAMATLYFTAPLARRRPNGLVAWALAFLVIHIVNPLQIADVGSQLSFAVMLALVLAGRFGRATIPRRWEALFLTGAAWAAGVPIAAMVFGRITPGGLLANLFLLVAAGYSVIAGAIGVLASYVSKTLAIHFNGFSALMTDAMVLVSDIIARLPGSNFDIEPWGFGTCALWYLAFGLVFVLLSLVRARRNLV